MHYFQRSLDVIQPLSKYNLVVNVRTSADHPPPGGDSVKGPHMVVKCLLKGNSKAKGAHDGHKNILALAVRELLAIPLSKWRLFNVVVAQSFPRSS